MSTPTLIGQVSRLQALLSLTGALPALVDCGCPRFAAGSAVSPTRGATSWANGGKGFPQETVTLRQPLSLAKAPLFCAMASLLVSATYVQDAFRAAVRPLRSLAG
jgi:hypothetical protein